MNMQCLQCSVAFDLTKDETAFYGKIAPKGCPVPIPSLCAQCRLQRRMAWRNDRTFYQRTCDLSGQKFISLYPQSAPFPVYKPSEWYSDKWDPLSYGQAFDFSRPFFDQWKELMLKVPRLGIDIVNCENSDYCNYCGDDKNCYLDIAGEGNEDCYYNLFTKYSKNCVDCTFAYHCTLCYECIQCFQSYSCKHAMYLENCTDCAFCFDCKGCKNCLLSINLRNKEYYILNEPHTKEEYERKLKELNLGSHASLLRVADIWKQMRIEKGVYRDMVNVNCEGCTGNDLKNAKNCHNCFNAVNSEDCAYLYDVLDAKDCRDLNYSLYQPEVSLELISTLALKFSGFCMASHYCSNVFYCDLTNNSKNLFGCIGLNHKEYCILNKQYSKEEYEDLVPKIINHMCKDDGDAPPHSLRLGDRASHEPEPLRANGSWGQFFPQSICPFGYNETVAQEYLPLSQEEVEKRGWLWRAEESNGKSTLGPSVAIPDTITDSDDSVCGSILQCEITGKSYKVIPQELKFYRQMGIPLPRRSPLQRHLDRNALRNPRTLWSRSCGKCGRGIQTTYSPERPERVHCEECYLKEVY